MAAGVPGGDRWTSGAAYERYVGRWSRRVAAEVVDRLAVPPGRRWLDVGCGTGALTAAILERAEPATVVGVDPSDGFLAAARETIRDARATFVVGSADATGLLDGVVDVVASGLVLNFVPDPAAALAEARRVLVPGGTVSAHVWDYADGMRFMRHFWDVAVAIDPRAAAADEAARFPIATEAGLGAAFRAAGFADVRVEGIVVPTVFADFDDLWQPFLGATGAAPSYLASVEPATRDAIRDALRRAVPTEPDGSIPLTARAWWATGRRR